MISLRQRAVVTPTSPGCPWAVIERGCVRIEDDVVVTDAGYENLNTAIPKRIPEVEAWVRAGR